MKKGYNKKMWIPLVLWFVVECRMKRCDVFSQSVLIFKQRGCIIFSSTVEFRL